MLEREFENLGVIAKEETNHFHHAPRFVIDSSLSPNARTYADAHGSSDLINSRGVSTVTSFPASISAIRDPSRKASCRSWVTKTTVVLSLCRNVRNSRCNSSRVRG